MTTYAHMCRDGHTEIGHNDSSSEMCPLCDLRAQLAQREQERETLRGAFESEHGDRMVLLLHVRDMEAERDAARAALSTVAAAILPDETKRATWDAAAPASLATAHREDSAWMDEHHDTLEADPVPAAREGKE